MKKLLLFAFAILFAMDAMAQTPAMLIQDRNDGNHGFFQFACGLFKFECFGFFAKIHTASPFLEVTSLYIKETFLSL